MKFAHLRKIDRVSIKKVERKKSILSFCEDKVVVYEQTTEKKQESSIQNLSETEIQKIIEEQEKELNAIMES